MQRHTEVREVVETFGLDLRGLTVLTELATGPFCVTPVIAALAGAEAVFAVGNDSPYGSYSNAQDQVLALAKPLAVDHRITPVRRNEIRELRGVNIVTNLGHVRPIDESTLSSTSHPACVALMWEPWEFRPEDIDIAYCARREIPVIGTNEANDLIAMGRYLGMLAAKLLLDKRVPIIFSRLLILGNFEFSQPIRTFLSELGAEVIIGSPETLTRIHSEIQSFQAIISADHSVSPSIKQSEVVNLIESAVAKGVSIINISGLTTEMPFSRKAREGIHPKLAQARRYMAANTGELGLSPVLRLHSGGLRAAQEVCRSLAQGASSREAVEKGVQSGFGLAVDEEG